MRFPRLVAAVLSAGLVLGGRAADDTGDRDAGAAVTAD